VREKRQSVGLAFATTSADLMALRTQTIDAAVCDAISAGTRQVVILGAGLDGRAWRMKELAGVRVFEIDHPATQAFKRARLNALPPMIGEVTFVALDFDRQGLDDALSRAGHDPLRPTCWIWEGVVMYLAPDTMRATLAQIARRSARDSTLIINYHTSMRSAFVRFVLRFIGEPVKSAWQPEAIAGELRAAGFGVVEDGGVEEWVSRFADPGVNTRAGRVMRIVVARRR
jgi:methyltransferase (TIGR00027 family)